LESFKASGLREELLRALKEEGYEAPTQIQKEAIPLILEGGDLLASAETGTGKTASFVLPVLHNLMKKPKKANPSVRALILTPTRELAAQVGERVCVYGQHLPLKSACVFGGVNIRPQIGKLRKGVDVLVATPGRLLDLIEHKAVDLSHVETFVLDEADRMLDMGFIPAIRRIISMLPKERQNLLFSATFSKEIEQLVDKLLQAPKRIHAAKQNQPASAVTHVIHPVDSKNKTKLLSFLITSQNWSRVLVFTRTKHRANRLTEDLISKGIISTAIHGNKSQGARLKALADFKRGSVRVLVATDIAARGIDIDQLPQVVNFDLPNVPEDYVHRIGRTGRAGNLGNAISLVSREEQQFLRDIEKLLKQPIEKVVVSGFEVDPSIPAQPVESQPARRGFNRKKRPSHPFSNRKTMFKGRKRRGS
jgi:ATP-dependent RNA helicase RhlE